MVKFKRLLIIAAVALIALVSPGALAGTSPLFCVDASGPGLAVGTATCPTDGSINIATSNVGYNLGGNNAIRFPSSDSTSGSSIAVGLGALSGQSGSSAAYSNTAVGYQAMGNGNTMTTAALANVAMGRRALGALTTGPNNTAIGSAAEFANTTGSSNTAVGQGALQNNQTGSSNTAVGQGALLGVASNSMSGDTAIGNLSMTAVTTGGTNTALGYNSCHTLTTGGGNICLGYNADVAANNTASWMNIGNAIYETLAAPTIASGFGSSSSVVNGTSSASFTVNVGTGGASSSGVLTLAAAPHGWNCDAVDQTNSASFVTACVNTSASTVTCTNYSRTTGTAIAWTASDVLGIKCAGY